MVGITRRLRSNIWYGLGEVSRRTSRIGTLGLALLLVASLPVCAEDGSSPDSSPSATPATAAAANVAPVPPAPTLGPALAAVSATRTARPATLATVKPVTNAAAKPAAKAKTTVAAKSKRDYRVGKWKLNRLKWRQLWLNSGDELPATTVGPTDDRGIPMRALGASGRLVYNPTVIAQQGLKRLDSYKRTGKMGHLRQARKFIDKLKEISDGGKIRRWQPHWYPYADFERGWVNANSHGLVLAFISRYYRITGNNQRFAGADRLLAAFKQRPGNQRWFSDTTKRGYLWFEHWPDGRHRHTLNAHLNAMFGLYDYWYVTGSPLAKQLFLAGAKTVRDKLKMFRRPGDLSRYSLGVDNGTLHYHETHIAQLRVLAKITGDVWFDRAADRLVEDEASWKAKFRSGGTPGGR
jgi:D-glucuronyl C5-epimerase C-terminus